MIQTCCPSLVNIFTLPGWPPSYPVLTIPCVQMTHNFLPLVLTYFLSSNSIYLIAFHHFKLHILPALLTHTVQVEFIVLFFQNCLSPRTPISITTQAKNLGIILSSFLLIIHQSSKSFSPIISPFQLLSLLFIPFSSHWYSHCLVFRLGYYYPVLTNYHASSFAFCNLSSIQLWE